MANNKVTSRQKVETTPLRSAAFINDLIDVVNDYRTLRTGSRPGKSIHNTPSTDCVKVKNLTGANLPRGSVVQLGDYLLGTLDPRNLIFEGNTVAAPVSLKYAILRQPLKTNAIGWAQCSGVCTALIDLADEGDRFANPVAGEIHLESAPSGPIEILSPVLIESGASESSESLHELVVRLCSPPSIIYGRTRGAINKDDFGTMEILSGTHGSETRTGILVEVLNRYADLQNWVRCHAVRIDSGGFDLIAGDCEDPGDEESSSSVNSSSS